MNLNRLPRSIGRFGLVAVAAVTLIAFGHRSAAAAPVANQDNYEIVPNTSLDVPAPGVLGNDTGNPVEAILVAPAANGTVTLNPDGSFLYVPNPGFNGVDQFVYQTGDGQELSNNTPVFILVNTVPTGVDDAYATPADTQLVVAAPGVVGNDVDPDGGALGAAISDSTNNGTLALNEADGSFTYSPNPGFEGADSFAYQPFDGFVAGPGAWVTIVVGDGSAPPVAADDQWSIGTGSIGVGVPGVLVNDVDPDGDPLSSVLVAKPAAGTVTLNADGSFFYETDPGFTGTDSFTYQAFDGTALSNVATVTFLVDSPPVAADDDYSTPLDTPLVVSAPGVLGNDGDPDGDPVSAFPPFDGPFHGALAFNGADGSFTYTPDAGFLGLDQFVYSVTDGKSGSNPAFVTIAVGQQAANQVPLVQDDTYEIAEGTALSVPAPGLLANDTDPDGDPLALTGVDDALLAGTVAADPNGGFLFTPDPGFVGTTSFAYSVEDGHGAADDGLVTIEVTAAPDPSADPAPEPSPAPDPTEPGETGPDAAPDPAGSTTSTTPLVTSLPNTGAGPDTAGRGHSAELVLSGLLLLASLVIASGSVHPSTSFGRFVLGHRLLRSTRMPR